MDEAEAPTAWQRFWDRGGWWRAVLVAVVYIVVYELAGLLIGAVFAGAIDRADPLSSASSVLVGVALPILVMGLAVLGFVISLRWQRPIFGRQPVPGRWWMWLAVVFLVVPVGLRLAATNWAAYTPALLASMLVLGLCVGFAEEILTRGVAVHLLRLGGSSERVVMVVSSLVFALLHSSNLLTGQSPLVVALTVVYTFGFGTMMYLAMRATGYLVWAMLLHAATDPTTILATGGIDGSGASAGSAALLGIAGAFNWVYVIAGLIAIIFVSGRAFAPPSVDTSSSDPEVDR
jgi:Cation transport ATPase